MLEMFKGMVNSPETTITNDINAEDTIIYVLDETNVPEELPNLMTLGTGTSAETVKVLEVNGNALTVERGFQGVPRKWNAGSVIARNFTEYDYNALKENIETLKENTDTNADDILDLMSYVGDLENLDTTEKANLVLALNETYQELATHKADSASHSKTARFVIGTSTSGWTAKQCDYLCDGTDDQEEIIQALNDLPVTGGEIVILDGTYNITASIHIPKNNVSLRGNGNATTLKRMYNSTDTDDGSTARGLIALNGKSGCKIQGLQIDGNKATYTASYNFGILLKSSSNNTITGNTCNNNNYGIYLNLSSDNTITDNTCNNNSNNGIRLHSSSNNTITGNTCNNNNYGIYLNSSSNNTVTDNTCNNNDYGIFLNSSSNSTVTGNTCNNNNNNGIRLYSSSNNTITGNTCNNNDYGIFLNSSSNNTITGNTCIRGTGQTSDYASDQYTIQLQGTSNYNLISSNNCMGKAVVISGGTGNSAWGNKYDSGNNLP